MKNGSAPEITNEDLRRWVDRIGDATIPLFAGFGFTTLTIVSADADKFRWPGLTILVLAITSAFLIMAVQSTHQARMYLPTLEDFQKLRESEDSPPNWANENSVEYKRARIWGTATRATYHLGIVSLLAGLGLALAPPGSKGVDYVLRWSASAIAFSVCLLEFAGTSRQWLPRRHRHQHDQSPGYPN
jgi:hypothetical protein